MSANDAQESKLKQRLYEVRRRRLRKLADTYDTLTEFALAVDEPLSYISRLLQPGKKGRKNLGEPKARKFELRLGLGTGWLDDDSDTRTVDEAAPAPWPFKSFPRSVWDGLNATEKRKAESMFLTIVQGIEQQREQQKDTG